MYNIYCGFCLLLLNLHNNNNISSITPVKIIDMNKPEEKNMNQKTQRLSIIRKIIRSEFISSQEELIVRLAENGVQVTQSTLSRDLKFMHVAKVPHKEKGYIYVLPDSVRGDHSVSTNATDNILSIAFSGNMCVITTKPGYASAISVPIDSKDIYEILGTIAGDNTILLVLREGFVMENLVNELCMIYPSIRILL